MSVQINLTAGAILFKGTKTNVTKTIMRRTAITNKLTK